MFFTPGTHKDHGLRYNPLKGLVLPRPIGWISSVDPDGIVNLAPFSYFNAVSDDPPCVVFSSGTAAHGGPKDTLANVQATGEFVANLASWQHRHAVKTTSESVEPSVNEFELAGLQAAPSELVAPPRVVGAPAHLECRVHQIVAMPPAASGRVATLVIGQVVGIHIDDAVIVDGIVDVTLMKPIARLGYKQYAVIETAFEMPD